MLEFEALLRSYADRVEGYLHSCFTDADEPQQVLFDAMRYSLLAGGKRLRPVLAQAFCELCGGSAMDALPFAAAVEMVHTYSLIHDDLPCMDNDDYRRGRLTNHKVYGEATAVLAGDALLTAAFGHLAAAPLPASRVVKATRVLSLCAGELGMVGGQVLDMEAEHRVCTEEEVLAIQSRKTGALISAACQLGVIAALDDVVHRPGAHGGEDHVVGLVGGEEDDLQAGLLLQDVLGGPDARRGGLHLDVHEDEVAVGGEGQGLDVPAAAGAPHHRHVLLSL